MLCKNEGYLNAILKPSTAGVRVLSIDGGGARGVVPLEHLLLLQSLMTEIPLQDLFDLVVGTSAGKNPPLQSFVSDVAGGIIALGLFILRWDVLKCSKTFETLARRIFAKRRPMTSWWSKVKTAVRCWVSDGAYDPLVMETCLKEAFGVMRRVFDAFPGVPSGTRVAVTTASISNASTFIFANYNGSSTRNGSAGPPTQDHC
jgi:hypothetical protein